MGVTTTRDTIMKRITLLLAALGTVGALTMAAPQGKQVAGPFIYAKKEIPTDPVPVDPLLDPDLKANILFASIQGGGTQELELAAGEQWANRPYLLLGSASGMGPGVSMGSINLGLNPDAYMVMTASQPNSAALQNTFGSLDESGRATARINVPPGMPAMQLHHAYVLFGSHNKVVYASGSVELNIQ